MGTEARATAERRGRKPRTGAGRGPGRGTGAGCRPSPFRKQAETAHPGSRRAVSVDLACFRNAGGGRARAAAEARVAARAAAATGRGRRPGTGGGCRPAPSRTPAPPGGNGQGPACRGCTRTRCRHRRCPRRARRCRARECSPRRRAAGSPASCGCRAAAPSRAAAPRGVRTRRRPRRWGSVPGGDQPPVGVDVQRRAVVVAVAAGRGVGPVDVDHDGVPAVGPQVLREELGVRENLRLGDGRAVAVPAVPAHRRAGDIGHGGASRDGGKAGAIRERMPRTRAPRAGPAR